MAEGVFCDYVQVTFPEEGWLDARGAVGPVLDSIGMQVEVDDERGGLVLWRGGGDGTVKAKRINGVYALGASGSVLAGLRMAGLLHRYLSEVGAQPHRVTRLDVTLDVPERTAPVIEKIATDVVSADGVALSRKRVSAKHCTRYVTRTAQGEDTGTIYLGSAQADVRLCVYDKQQERIDKGLPDVGHPLTRYELRLRGGTGVTLRDAVEPEAVFWHYVSPAVLPKPLGVPEWVAHGSGFYLDRPELPLPAERLRRRVQASADAVALVRLADEVGPYGFAMLCSELRKLVANGDDDASRLTRAIGGSPASALGQPLPSPLLS